MTLHELGHVVGGLPKTQSEDIDHTVDYDPSPPIWSALQTKWAVSAASVMHKEHDSQYFNVKQVLDVRSSINPVLDP